MITCPLDGRQNIEGSKCPQCETDLSSIQRIKELPNAYYNEGIVLSREGKLDEAIEKIMSAVSLKPDFTDAYILLAKIFAQKELYSEAVTNLNKAISLDPGNERAVLIKKKIEEKINQNNLIKIKYEKKLKTVKNLLILIPIVTFSIGILSVLFIQWESKPSTDLLISQIKNEISRDTLLNSLQMKIEANENTITINGVVPSIFHKSLAHRIVKNINGDQFKLVNLLTVQTKKPEYLYTIKRGDNLASIANLFYNDKQKWNILSEANKNQISNPANIKAGQVLKIPLEETKLVRKF